MGVDAHVAMVVTDWKEERLVEARLRALLIFPGLVTEVVQSPANGWMSFFIAPSGSKLGWHRYRDHSDALKKFAATLCCNWSIAQYGEVPMFTLVVIIREHAKFAVVPTEELHKYDLQAIDDRSELTESQLADAREIIERIETGDLREWASVPKPFAADAILTLRPQ